MASDGNDSYEPGNWIYLVYLSTLAPWTFMQMFDALDGTRRRVEDVPVRLGTSLCFVLISTTVGLWYVVWAAGRSRTESATMLIGVLLNSWYWKRNVRGWRSYRVLLSQRKRVCLLATRFMNMRIKGMPGTVSDPEMGMDANVTTEDWNKQWHLLWVNDTVIDNDEREDGVSFASWSWDATIGGDVLWRMVWLQGAIGKPLRDTGKIPDNEQRQAALYDVGPPPCHGEKEVITEEALDHEIRVTIEDDVAKAVSVPRLRAILGRMSHDDQESLKAKAAARSKGRLEKWKPHTREQRIESLVHYDVGQQDIGGLPPTTGSHPASLDALWCAMSWVTGSAPHPMENIWYESTALVDHLEQFATDEGLGQSARAQWPMFPRISQWYRIAGDLARLRDVPLLLSVREGKRYALRLASVSALLAYHYNDYLVLCSRVHQLGIKARWTHGWSGLVACYSMYWTVGNVCVALLGGLPLMVIKGGGVGHPSVESLLVGLASETIMDTYLSDARRAARTKELSRRYYLDKGRTCRGSGMGCIREALEALSLPRSASQLDGVIAFSAGWSKEALDGLPGSQQPRDGQDHCQIEDLYCSSRAYRFPDERL